MIGELIKKERRLKGWSQVQLAKNAGVSFLTINRIEKNKNTGSEILSKVVKGLGMELLYELKPIMLGEVFTTQENIL